METRIYSYGACIKSCPPKLDHLLRQQARYYNTLVELENLRRAMFAGLEEDSSLGVADALFLLRKAECRVKAEFDAIAEYRKATRTRGIPADLKTARDFAVEAKKQAAVTLRVVKATHRAQHDAANDEFLRRRTVATSSADMSELAPLNGDELRKRVAAIRLAEGPIAPRTSEKLNQSILEEMLSEPRWPQSWKQTQFLDSEILRHIKLARAASGLPHGTYSLADDAVDAAKKMQKVGDLERKWVPFDDDLPVSESGRVGVQLPGGLSVPDLLGCGNNRLRLRVETAEERERAGFGNRSARWLRRNTRAVASLAIDSGDDGWERIDIPISYHRPLPPNATIKWVWILVRRDGRRLRYNLQFTITFPDAIDVGHERRAEVCVVNPGWRHFDDGSIRVAYVVGSDGNTEDLRLPGTQGNQRSVAERIAFADSLQSASDKLFNEAREVFSQLLPELPESVRDRCRSISHWRDHRKLHRVINQVLVNELPEYRATFRTWVTERKSAGLDLMPTTTDGFPRLWYLYCWTRKDDHLYQMAIDISRKAKRHRDQLFSIWAKRLSERYKTVLIAKDCALTEFAKSSDDRTSGQLREKSRAAAGGLIEKLIEKFSAKHTVRDNGANASRTCITCGHTDPDLDLAKSNQFVCATCGSKQDQDETNCRNRLAWYCEKRGEPKTV